MKPDLLGYLLGALDGPEHEAITRKLDKDHSLRQELHEVETRLAPLQGERWQYTPPVGLAARVCQLVMDFDDQPKVRPRMSARPEPSGHRGQWTVSDMVVTAGVLAASCMLFFPAVANSRHQARLAACQNNMRVFGVALPSWADRFSENLPYIPTQGNTAVAGFYAPQLTEAGYVTDSNLFLCPSSDLAKQRRTFFVPSIDSIRNAQGQELATLQRKMGGSYAYILGHFHQGRHRATRLKGRTHFAVMSDRVEILGQRTFANAHGGRGVVVLFEDGHARLIVLAPKRTAQERTEPAPIDPWNDLFVSDRGLIEAGNHEDDVVLGSSWAKPVATLGELVPCGVNP